MIPRTLGLVVFTSFLALSAFAVKKPNVILIMCGDMGFSDIGCYRGEVNMPNLDGLAGDGMCFTQFYSNAKFTTTRASVVKGLFPHKSFLDRSMLAITEVMKLAGSRTAVSGKWHLGLGDDTHSYKCGFNEYYGLLDVCCNFFNPSLRNPPYKGGRKHEFSRSLVSLGKKDGSWSEGVIAFKQLVFKE